MKRPRRVLAIVALIVGLVGFEAFFIQHVHAVMAPTAAVPTPSAAVSLSSTAVPTPRSAVSTLPVAAPAFRTAAPPPRAAIHPPRAAARPPRGAVPWAAVPVPPVPIPMPPGPVPTPPAPVAPPPAALSSPSPRPLGPPPAFGVDTHCFYLHDSDKMSHALTMFESVGGTWMRETFPWMGIEPARGIFRWQRADAVVEMAEEHHLKLLVTLAYCPPWARSDQGMGRNMPPSNPRDYENFVYQTVARYRGRVAAWELWNEEDWPVFWGPQMPFAERVRTYREVLEAGYRGAHRADPNARVLNGGMGMADSLPVFDQRHRAWGGLPRIIGQRPIPPEQQSPQWLDDLLSKPGAGASFDVFAIHVLRPAADQILGSVLPVLARHHVDKPIWITESGQPSGPPGRNSEAEQAQFLDGMFASCRRYGIRVYVWHELVDKGDDAQNPESHFGLLRADLSEKPAFGELRRLLGH